METTELTFGRSAKIWWSFMWRNFLFALPVMVLWMVFAWFFMPTIGPGQKPAFPFAILLAWPLMMVAVCATQVLALKYALSAKWAEFRIVAVKTDVNL